VGGNCTFLAKEAQPSHRWSLANHGAGFQNCLPRSFAEEIFPFIFHFGAWNFANSHVAHVRVVRIRKTSNAEMKRKTSSAELPDKTIWNPRPVIGLLRHRGPLRNWVVLPACFGPAFSALLTNKSLLTSAVCRCRRTWPLATLRLRLRLRHVPIALGTWHLRGIEGRLGHPSKSVI
jgi:hypothetical protein